MKLFAAMCAPLPSFLPQVLKREAEDRASELARKLAVAQGRLAELQQQAEDSEADMGSQLYQAQAQLVRAKADLAASRAAAAVAAVTKSSDAGRPQHQPAVAAEQLIEVRAVAAEGSTADPQHHQGLSTLSAGVDRQRSVAAQLETAEQLMRSMRATAAAALCDSLSTGALPNSPSHQPHPAGGSSSGGGSGCHPAAPCSTSPFKAWSATVSSLDQHMQAAAGVHWGGDDGSKTSPKGGWLYNKLFASKEPSSSNGGAACEEAVVAAPQHLTGQAWRVDPAIAAAGAEAPCLY